MTQQNPYTPPVVNSQSQSPRSGIPIASILLVATPIFCLAFGTAAGAVSRIVRNDNAGFHVEALVELGAKIFVNVAVLFLCLLIPAKWLRILNYVVATTLLWVSSTIAWTVMNGSTFPAHLQVNMVSVAIALTFGILALFAFSLLKRSRQTTGTST